MPAGSRYGDALGGLDAAGRPLLPVAGAVLLTLTVAPATGGVGVRRDASGLSAAVPLGSALALIARAADSATGAQVPGATLRAWLAGDDPAGPGRAFRETSPGVYLLALGPDVLAEGATAARVVAQPGTVQQAVVSLTLTASARG